MIKKITALLLLISLILITAGCDTTPAIKICVSDRYSDAATPLTEAFTNNKIKYELVSIEKEADIPADSDAGVIVIGYLQNDALNELTDGYNIHDCCVRQLDAFTYIGGRSDCPVDDVKSLVRQFTDKAVADGEYNPDVSLEYTDGRPLDISQINGKPLTEFRIVYSESDGQIDINKSVASYLQQQLSQNTGKTPKIVGESSNEAECEIYIGKCQNRPSSDVGSEIGDNGFAYRISGGSIAVSANSVLLGCRAVSELLEMLIAAENTSVSQEVFKKCDDVTFIKVACVGDSITQGDAGNFNYPWYLQQMLGFKYHVINCGKSGYSTRTNDPYPYIGTAEYNNALAFKPDVMIYMLGTNDCQPTKNWTDQTVTEYKKSANIIFDAFEKINPDIQVFVVLPPSLFENNVWQGWEKWSQQVRDHAVPLNRELATERGYALIDAYSWSLDNSYVFKDGLHPSGTTYRNFAECIYDGIKDSIKK